MPTSTSESLVLDAQGFDFTNGLKDLVKVYPTFKGCTHKVTKALPKARQAVATDQQVSVGAVRSPTVDLLPAYFDAECTRVACGPDNAFVLFCREVRSARAFVDQYACPTGKDGERLMEVGFVDEFHAGFQQKKAGIIRALGRLVLDWDRLVSIAAQALNGKFNPADYRTVQEWRDGMMVSVSYALIQEGHAFANLRSKVLRESQAEVEAANREMLAKSASAIGQRLLDAVGELAGKLTNPRAQFGELPAFVEGLANLCDVIPERLNITHDTHLNTAAAEVSALLKNLDLSGIKENMGARIQQASVAEAISNRFASLGNRRF